MPAEVPPPTFADLQAAQGTDGRVNPASLAMDDALDLLSEVCDDPDDDDSDYGRGFAAGVAAGRSQAAKRLGILPGSEVWRLAVGDGSDG